MADTAGPVAEPGLEPRVARLEADAAHRHGEVAEIFAIVRLVGVPSTRLAQFPS
jgi:hypothetical protein